MIESISQIVLGLLCIYVLYKFIQSIQLVPTQSAYIVERLGNYHKTLGPGFHALVPFFDQVAYKQDLREETIEVQPQECFTKDNVRVEVDGVIYLAVIDPVNASYGVPTIALPPCSWHRPLRALLLVRWIWMTPSKTALSSTKRW